MPVTSESEQEWLRVHAYLNRNRHDLAVRAEDVLGPQPLGERVRGGRRLGVEDELHDPGAVAQVDEDQPAVVAAPVHPARDARRRARPRGVQLTGRNLSALPDRVDFFLALRG